MNSLLRAIRAKCPDCSGGSVDEVRLCPCRSWTLQRDPRIKLTRFELEFLLADDPALIEQQLFSLLVDRVHLDHADVVDGAEP
jgi:hypothetical protein